MAIKSKFLISWIVLITIFISLSVSSAEHKVEGHRCYWCGPLAEQVHRSQRAPKCNGDRSKVTVCDDDLPYCAIVAKSPPYIESRYCVKIYQDECYSLYCNTTKTWKVICPCRGELCNGINTIRENEAFKALHKHNILIKHKSFKRSIMSNVGFIGITGSKNKIDNVTNDENKYAQNETGGKIVTETENDDMNSIAKINTNHGEDNKANVSEIKTEPEATSESSVSSTIEDTFINNSENIKTEITQSSEHATTETTFLEKSLSATSDTVPAAFNTDNFVNNSKQQSNDSTIKTINENNGNKTNVSDIQSDIDSEEMISEDQNTEIILMSSEIPKLGNNTRIPNINTKLSENMSRIYTTTTETIPTTKYTRVTPVNLEQSNTTESKMDVTVSKSKEKLPTAEALQHNETPATKTTEQMFTTKNMNMLTEITTQAITPRNNSAIRADAHIFTVVIGIILYY